MDIFNQSRETTLLDDNDDLLGLTPAMDFTHLPENASAVMEGSANSPKGSSSGANNLPTATEDCYVDVGASSFSQETPLSSNTNQDQDSSLDVDASAPSQEPSTSGIQPTEENHRALVLAQAALQIQNPNNRLFIEFEYDENVAHGLDLYRADCRPGSILARTIRLMDYLEENDVALDYSNRRGQMLDDDKNHTFVDISTLDKDSKECEICYTELNNHKPGNSLSSNNGAVAVSCGNGHVLCSSCYHTHLMSGSNRVCHKCRGKIAIPNWNVIPELSDCWVTVRNHHETCASPWTEDQFYHRIHIEKFFPITKNEWVHQLSLLILGLKIARSAADLEYECERALALINLLFGELVRRGKMARNSRTISLLNKHQRKGIMTAEHIRFLSREHPHLLENELRLLMLQGLCETFWHYEELVLDERPAPSSQYRYWDNEMLKSYIDEWNIDEARVRHEIVAVRHALDFQMFRIRRDPLLNLSFMEYLEYRNHLLVSHFEDAYTQVCEDEEVRRRRVAYRKTIQWEGLRKEEEECLVEQWDQGNLTT